MPFHTPHVLTLAVLLGTRLLLTLVGVVGFGSTVAAQSMPTLGTEDADLGGVSIVGDGPFHATMVFDVRNGDFVRGDVDDDAADGEQIPVHLQVGLGYGLHRDAKGAIDRWLIFRTSNGFHDPRPEEEVAPRPFYETNNLIGAVFTVRPGLQVGGVYTFKTSPNAISGFTQEISGTMAYDSDEGIGAWGPSVQASVRTKGNGGLYTQAGVEPQFEVPGTGGGLRLNVPTKFGVGWGGFYGDDTGQAVFASTGLAYSRPFAMGAARCRLRLEGLAIFRDGTLQRIGAGTNETAAVVPLLTALLSLSY